MHRMKANEVTSQVIKISAPFVAMDGTLLESVLSLMLLGVLQESPPSLLFEKNVFVL